MEFFDFHHHHRDGRAGIYNLEPESSSSVGKFSVGIHPNRIVEGKLELPDDFITTAQLTECVAIGECGLDSRVKIPEKQQISIFVQQIQLANELKKPLIIHCVNRYPEVIRCVSKSTTRKALHGFNKNENIARLLLEAGFYLSFGSALLRNVSLQNIFKNCPAHTFLLETDDSEQDIAKLYTLAAELRKASEETVLQQVYENLATFLHG